jgi:iron complex transport system ATP-binding protein
MDEIDLPIAGVQCEIKDDTLIISSERQLRTLGSSLLGGGFNRTRHILNHHVVKDFSHRSPSAYLKKLAVELGIEERVVAMMTAADLDNLSISSASEEDLEIVAIVTGGVSNAAVAGEPATERGAAGTINTILLIDGKLARAAMAGAIVTATEAKSAALRELEVKSGATGGSATGTTTDAVVVACTGRGTRLNYSGTATILGELVGRTTKKATTDAIKAQEGWL